jgi:hypothetical protein
MARTKQQTLRRTFGPITNPLLHARNIYCYLLSTTLTQLHTTKYQLLQQSNNKKQKVESEQQYSNVELLTDDIWYMIISFAFDRETAGTLELVNKKLLNIMKEESELWNVITNDYKLNVSDSRNAKQLLLEATFVNMVCDKLRGFVKREEKSLAPQLKLMNYRYLWYYSINNTRKEELLNDYEIECWKEAFYLAYNNQKSLNDEDIKRCPLVYNILKIEEPDMFNPAFTAAAQPQIQFHENGEFRAQDEDYVSPFPYKNKKISYIWGTSCPDGPSYYKLKNLIYQRCELNQPESVTPDSNKRSRPNTEYSIVTKTEEHHIPTVAYNRSSTVSHMRRRIDWDDVETVYAYKQHPNPSDEASANYSRYGALIGKLKDGRYIRMMVNVFSGYCDYNCGTIWTCDKLYPLFAVPETDSTFR